MVQLDGCMNNNLDLCGFDFRLLMYLEISRLVAFGFIASMLFGLLPLVIVGFQNIPCGKQFSKWILIAVN